MSIDFVSDQEKLEANRIRKDYIFKKLREKGCRITKQRKIILDIILEEECDCCKEIYYRSLKIDPSIGSATVYRMVNTLEEIGAINPGNKYRIKGECQCIQDKECRIIFDDNHCCCLNAKELEKVMQAGLSACGFIGNQKISRIEIQENS